MYTRLKQDAIRQDIFRWLELKTLEGKAEFSRTELESYTYEGVRIPLLDRGRGIRNPSQFDESLTIMTSYDSPYADVVDLDAFLLYSYQAADRGDNVKLSRAHEAKVPLVYFQGIRPGVYVPFYPVYVVADDKASKKFVVALDETLRIFTDPLAMSADQRRYAERIVRQRLHQPVFRARVMHAYQGRCAVCDLRHVELLDAAHIIPDWHALGFTQVTNGLALCKIHHAAYDLNLLGISPALKIQIDDQLLDEIDGPMLRHGLQDMHGRTIQVPTRVADRPSRDALAMRFAEFAA